MEEEKLTIASIAQEMYDNMEWSKRSKGDKFIKCIEDIDWQKDIIYKAHGDRLPDDDIYDRIHTILDRISKCNSDEQAYDALNEIEADIYHHDLAKWLANDTNNMWFIEESIKEGMPENGWMLFQRAQSKYIQEIGDALIEGIQEYIDS